MEHLTYDKKPAERKTLRKRNKWSAWATHVKRLTKRGMEHVSEASESMELADDECGDEGSRSATLGKYWKDSYPG